MSIGTLMRELGRFVKDQFRKIMIGAIIIALMVVGVRLGWTHLQYQQVKAAYQDLAERYAQEPAEFQMVVGLEDGTLFNNSYVFDEYFSQQQLVAQIEQETGIKYGQWLEDEKQLELYKTALFRGGLAAVRNTSSDVITVRILVGKTAEENLAIAKAYQKLVETNQIDFLSTHAVSILSDAAIGERLPLETNLNVATPQTLNLYAKPNAKSAVIYGIAGLILGVILTTAYLFLKRLWQAKIEYAFEYTWQLDDQHLLINQAQQPTLVQEAMTLPSGVARVAVAQSSLPQIATQTGLGQVNQAITEIIIVIQAGQTDKSWYEQQVDLARLFKVPVRILHIY